MGIALAVQLLALLVLVFGDIGFDKPGRFGLDFGHLLLLAALWVAALGVGLFLACRRRRFGIVALQLIAGVSTAVWFMAQ